MDRERLNKAAEEARMASAETLTTFGTHHYIDDVVAVTDMRLSYDEVAESAFIKGADWLMQQPLSERLTEEEKEKILEIHTTHAAIITESNDKVLNAYSTGVMTVIGHIFEDLFKDQHEKE